MGVKLVPLLFKALCYPVTKQVHPTNVFHVCAAFKAVLKHAAQAVVMYVAMEEAWLEKMLVNLHHTAISGVLSKLLCLSIQDPQRVRNQENVERADMLVFVAKQVELEVVQHLVHVVLNGVSKGGVEDEFMERRSEGAADVLTAYLVHLNKCPSYGGAVLQATLENHLIDDLAQHAFRGDLVISSKGNNNNKKGNNKNGNNSNTNNSNNKKKNKTQATQTQAHRVIVELVRLADKEYVDTIEMQFDPETGQPSTVHKQVASQFVQIRQHILEQVKPHIPALCTRLLESERQHKQASSRRHSSYQVPKPFTHERLLNVNMLVALLRKFPEQTACFLGPVPENGVTLLKQLTLWMVAYPNNTLYQSEFVRLVQIVLMGGGEGGGNTEEESDVTHENVLKLLLSKCGLVNVLVDGFLHQEGASNHGHFIQCLNVLRLRLDTLPRSHYVNQYLTSHSKYTENLQKYVCSVCSILPYLSPSQYYTLTSVDTYAHFTNSLLPPHPLFTHTPIHPPPSL